MAKDIDIAVRMRNEANAELQRLSKELGSVSRALRDMSGPANQAASSNQKVARSFDDAGRSADAATGKVSRFGAEIARGAAIGAGFAGLNAVMRGVGAGLDFVADSAIGMNSRLEQSQVAFTTMLGSAERADSFLRDLGDFAKTTPFEFPELVQTSQRLLAMGFAAGEVIPLMTDIGNVASSLGRGTEGIDRIVMALGQMESKTRVQTEELLQLQEIGVPALQILADAMGVTVAESQKMVSAGQVASDVFIGAFQEWSQVNFGDMMEQQSRTMTGAISNITDTLQMAAADGLRPFFDLARDGAVELADFLGSPEFESFASDLSEDIAGAADAVRTFVSDNREGLKETAEAFGTIAQNAESAGQMIGTVAGALNELKVPAAVKLLLEDLATLNERLANTIEITLDFDARVDYGETTPDNGVIDKLWRGLVSGDMIGSLVGVGREHGEAYYSGIEDGVSNASGAAGGSFGSDLMEELFQFDPAKMGPFLEDVIWGPLLSMEPQVREELKGIFTLDPDIGASFAASITGMVAEGSVSFEEGMNILSAIPRETLEPALQEIESDLHGKLAEALISGEDTNHIREQLDFVQGMLGETSEFVASSAVGFTEFGTAGEMAMADVATAAGALQEAVSGLSGAYSIGLDVQAQFTGQASEYGNQLGTIEKAYEAVQKKVEEGIELTEDEILLYEHGAGAMDTFTAAQHDGEVQAGLAAIANAELVKAQWELNEAIGRNEDDLQPYLDRVKDAEQFARDMGLATDDNTSSQDDFFNAVTDVITKLGELIDKLDGVPEKITTEIELNTASAIANYDGFLQYLRDNPGQSDLYVNQITNQGYTEFADGGISQGGLALVGEEGVELAKQGNKTALVGVGGPHFINLSAGTEIIPNDETVRMMEAMTGLPYVGAFADGTGGTGGSGSGSASIHSGDFTGVGLDIGDQILAGIMIAFGDNAVSDLMPGADAIARAIIDGAIVPVKSEIEGVPDWFEVNFERIPGLASGIGQDTAMALMQEYATLQGELQLAILSGEDTSKIDAELDAIEALFETWGTSVIGTAQTVGEAMETVARASAFEDMFATPSSGAPWTLDEIFSGEALDSLSQARQEWEALAEIAYSQGFNDLGDQYMQEVEKISQQEIQVNAVLDSDAGEELQADYDAEVTARNWELKIDSIIAGPGAAEGMMDDIADLESKIAFGENIGLPSEQIAAWEADLEQAKSDAAFYWYSVAEAAAAGLIDPAALEAFAEAGGDQFKMYLDTLVGPEAADQMVSGVNELGEQGFDALMGVFGSEQGKEVAGQFIDDIVDGLHEGSIDYEQAMALFGQMGSDALIPGLEAIEAQLTVDLVNAIIAGNTELEADILEKLELLGILQGELDLTIDKAKEYQALDLWSGPAGAPGTMGAGGGSGGGGYGGGGPQKSTGSSPTTGRNPNYEYNLGPDAHGYHYQTLRQKYGLDMSFQMATSGDVQGAHDFYNNPNQMGYKVEKVQDHLKKNPDLMNDPEYWAHLEEGYGIKKGFVTHGVSVTNVNPDGTIEYSGGGDQITYAPTGTGPPPGVHPLKMARGGVSMGMPLFNTIWGEAGQEAYLPLEGRGADVVAEALGSRITNPLLALLENIGRDDRVEAHDRIGRDDRVEAHDRIDRMEQRQVEMSEWFKVMVAMLERVVDAPFVLDGKEIHRSIGKVVMHTVNMRGSR